MLKKSVLALAAATVLIAGCSDDSGNLVDLPYYATDGAALYSGNANDSLNIDKKTLTGLNGGTLLYSIDVNPRTATTSSITGLGSDGQVYSIDVNTGVATPKGSPDTTLSLTNKAVEIDYNPRANAGATGDGQIFRVTTSTGENYRRNDSAGAPATYTAGRDTAFAYRTGDANAGKTVVVSGVAYTNSQPNTAVPARTTAFVIDSQNNVLAVLGGDPAVATAGDPGNPNAGQLTTRGSLREDIGTFVGFDIKSNGTDPTSTADVGYVTAFKDGTYNLYTVDLNNGALSFVTALNPKIVPVRSFAVKQ